MSPENASLTVTSTIFLLNQIIAYNNIMFIGKDGYINAGKGL